MQEFRYSTAEIGSGMFVLICRDDIDRIIEIPVVDGKLLSEESRELNPVRHVGVMEDSILGEAASNDWNTASCDNVVPKGLRQSLEHRHVERSRCHGLAGLANLVRVANDYWHSRDWAQFKDSEPARKATVAHESHANGRFRDRDMTVDPVVETE
jgi:hypothetical protein